MSNDRIEQYLDGLDHIVLAVQDLDDAADAWRKAGFVVSPRGVHSEFMGTANHTIMFQDDYIELLGVLSETKFNLPTRSFLSAGEGLERMAMRGQESAKAVAALQSDGVAATGPVDFRRPLVLADGTASEAAFRIFHWPDEPAPGGARLFACEHLTRDTVWLPELMAHPNGARGVRQVEVRVDAPEAEAATLARLLGLSAAPDAKGGMRVQMKPRGADIVYRTASDFDRLWGEHATSCTVVIETDALAAATDICAKNGNAATSTMQVAGATIAFVP
ncbi:VOC family protein [Roseovarius aestuarii]|nr:VOC family protein [Roseovarius aestuarii]